MTEHLRWVSVVSYYSERGLIRSTTFEELSELDARNEHPCH
jgi:hypothetical protein